MMLWRVLLVLAAVSATLIALESPAAATGYTCPDGVVVQVTVTPNEFTVAAVCGGHMTPGGQNDPPANEQPAGNSTEVGGTWVYDGYVCDNGGTCNSSQKCADGSTKKLYYFLSADGERGETKAVCPGDPDDPGLTITPPTPVQIFSAFKEAVPTESVLSVQPPGGQTLVNFETIFSSTADPFTTGKIDLVPGYKIEFEIAPVAFVWSFGDGITLPTDWAGKAWQAGDDVSKLINHVYTSTKDVKASVTTTWGANVRLNGGPLIPVNGTVDVTSPDVPLEILEAKPTLVR